MHEMEGVRRTDYFKSVARRPLPHTPYEYTTVAKTTANSSPVLICEPHVPFGLHPLAMTFYASDHYTVR